jgi:putative protease
MQSNHSQQKPELLAPAGSLEAFFAALDAGADAVYTGLKAFSARAKAKNFSLTDIEKMTWHLHGLDKRIYITINTLIKESELPQLIDLLAALEKIGVDAVILQDLAVWRLARAHFPGLELHASTQMTIHNSAGVKMLEQMGFSRGVLARELTLPEIAQIRRGTTLELEHFIHGALCFSFSGQCYFSSFLSGNSGNRGRCNQPCRRLHHYRHNQGYFFSPNDLSAIDLLPQLEQAGICSFKIEGRMKSAEYVHKVVAAYRRVLDAAEIERGQALKEAKQQLKESFGRQPTQGFLAGRQPSDMNIPSRKGATGRYLGEISRVHRGEISFKTRDSLQLGDRIRIQPASDQSGTAFTVRQLRLGQRQVNQAAGGSFVSIPSTFNQFKPGDGVFLVASSTAFNLSDAACRRRLSTARPPAQPVDLDLRVTPRQLQIRARVDQHSQLSDYAIESYPAEKTPLSAAILHKVFNATGGSRFRLRRLNCGTLPAIVIPPKQLKQIRRDLYQQLEQACPAQNADQLDAHRQQAVQDQLGSAPARQGLRQLRVQLKDARDSGLLQDPAVAAVLLPLTAQNLKQAQKLQRRAQQVIWDIPFILFEQDWQNSYQAIRQLVQNGFHHFRLNNLGHFPLFSELSDLTLYSSFRLFALNSQAIVALAQLGINEAELYIEDDRDNLAAILQRRLPIPTALTSYASAPLLSSRIDIKQLRADNPVLSDRGDAYRVERHQQQTWLRSESDFSFLAELAELESFGCFNFIIDLSHLGPFSPAGKQVLEAAKRGYDPDGTNKFNYPGELI